MAYDPYALDTQALQRRERMAMMMQQQALQPLEINSYQGIQAPISPLQSIAKVLQMYAGSRQLEESDESRKDIDYGRYRDMMGLVGVNLPEKRVMPTAETATQQLNQPVAAPMQTAPVQVPAQPAVQMPPAESFPIGPSGATQNLPPVSPVQYANALSGQGGVPSMPQVAPQGAPQGAPQMPVVGVPQTGRASIGQPTLPSVTGDTMKDVALMKTIGPQAYVQAALQKRLTAVGNLAIDNSGKVIFSGPSKEGTVDVQGPTGQFTRQEVANASDIETTRAAKAGYAKGAAESAVKRDEETFGVAQSAQTNIDRANEIIDLVNAGALTGTAAEIKLKLARALNVAGADNNEVIKNTEVLVSRLGQNVLGNIKASGLGAGQGFTNTDRTFLERIVGGSIELNPKSLQELARISKSVSAAAVDKWNKRLPDIAPNIAKDLGLKSIELNNVYSRSEIEAELKRRGLTR
jgi:hypothetical protein